MDAHEWMLMSMPDGCKLIIDIYRSISCVLFSCFLAGCEDTSRLVYSPVVQTCDAYLVADLMVVLGDTLHATPAGDIPGITLRKQTRPPARVVVCSSTKSALQDVAQMICACSPGAAYCVYRVTVLCVCCCD